GGQRCVHVLVQVERGQHDDPRAVPAPGGGQDPPGRLEPVHLRHPDVHQHDVRPVPERGRDRLPPVRGLGHHRDARRAEDQPEAAADQRLVVRDDHPGAGVRSYAHRGAARNLGRTGPADSPPSPRPPTRAEPSTGILARTRQPPPGRGPASSSPPYSPIRSRSPISPRPPDPGAPVAGRPSSVTAISRSSGRYSRTTAARAVPACLITLVSASCTTRYAARSTPGGRSRAPVTVSSTLSPAARTRSTRAGTRAAPGCGTSMSSSP